VTCTTCTGNQVTEDPHSPRPPRGLSNQPPGVRVGVRVRVRVRVRARAPPRALTPCRLADMEEVDESADVLPHNVRTRCQPRAEAPPPWLLLRDRNVMKPRSHTGLSCPVSQPDAVRVLQQHLGWEGGRNAQLLQLRDPPSSAATAAVAAARRPPASLLLLLSILLQLLWVTE
jgi:hypothetical protein